MNEVIKKVYQFNKENKSTIAKALGHILSSDDVSMNIKMYMIDKLLMRTTERENDESKNNKYYGQPYWTKKALEQIINQNNNMSIDKLKFIHEHCIPKKLIRNVILTLEKKDYKSIMHILENLAYAVVATEDDDRVLRKKGLNAKMPINHKLEINNTISNIFARYREAKIEIYKVRDVDNLSIENETDINALFCKVEKVDL